MPIFIAILMYGLWSTIFSLSKAALAHSPPFFLTGFRMFTAGVLLCGFIFLYKKVKFSLKQAGAIALLGVFSIYLTNILETWGIQYMPSSRACFIYSVSPFLAALLSYFHFNEKMNLQKWIGMTIGFLGVLPIIFSGDSVTSLSFGAVTAADLAIIGAAFFSVYGWVLLRLIVKDNSISPLLANGASMLIGGILALVHSFFSENWSGPTMLGPVTNTSIFLQIVLLMTLISNIICYNLYGMMLKKFTATILSFIGLLSPIFASFAGWLIMGESPTYTLFLSTGVLLLGLFIVYKAELKQGYILIKQQPKN